MCLWLSVWRHQSSRLHILPSNYNFAGTIADIFKRKTTYFEFFLEVYVIILTNLRGKNFKSNTTTCVTHFSVGAHRLIIVVNYCWAFLGHLFSVRHSNFGPWGFQKIFFKLVFWTTLSCIYFNVWWSHRSQREISI